MISKLTSVNLLVASCIFYLILIVTTYEANFPEHAHIYTGYSTYFRAFLIILAAIFVVIKMKFVKDGLIFVFSIYTGVGLLTGAIINTEHNLIIRHLFAACFMILMYWCGRIMTIDRRVFNKIIQVAAWAILAAYAIVFFKIQPLLEYNQVGFSSGPLLLSQAVGLTRGLPLLYIPSFLLILLGRKRGVILGSILMFILSIVFLNKKYSISQSVKILLIPFLIVLVFVVAFVIYLFKDVLIDLLPFTAGTMERFARFFEGNATISFLLSARDAEAKGVLDTLSKVPSGMGLLIGAGFGSTYELEYFSPYLQSRQSYILLQPDVVFNYFLMHSGFPAAFLVILFLLYRILMLYSKLGNSSLHQDIYLFLITYSLDMSLSFVPNNPLFWILLGYTFSVSNINRKTKKCHHNNCIIK
ncbi:hypothetical protein [Coleofasciculus sp. G2-EDA-02]|uniref:hypothetical protein n=1 Tax=Coleofasciculus sp. G2-EDA-02 TaxID=3069529 RepID=UPI0032F374C9